MTDHTDAVIDQTRCGMWRKLDKTMTWPIVMVWSMSKTKLTTHNYHDRSYIAVCGKNDTELLWSIRLGVDSDENQIRHLCDWLYIFGLCKKWN